MYTCPLARVIRYSTAWLNCVISRVVRLSLPLWRGTTVRVRPNAIFPSTLHYFIFALWQRLLRNGPIERTSFFFFFFLSLLESHERRLETFWLLRLRTSTFRGIARLRTRLQIRLWKSIIPRSLLTTRPSTTRSAATVAAETPSRLLAPRSLSFFFSFRCERMLDSCFIPSLRLALD